MCRYSLTHTRDPIEHNISKMAGFSYSVPKDHQQEMAYGMSNGYVTDDVTRLRKVKLDPDTVRTQCLKNSWRCYLATITNY